MIVIKTIRAEDTWPIRQIVMWPEKPIDFIKIDGDNGALHYGLYVEGQLSSVISCFVTKNEVQFRKFATLRDKQNQGLGSKLLSYIIEECKMKGCKRLYCNARVDKKAFYQKFGLMATDQGFLKDGIEFIIMEIKLN